ncbi:MAG: methionine--tRNA ligase [Actinomycetota bacterium]|nr:methionine--tRNA ligase [Actinomycetota bacterium]
MAGRFYVTTPIYYVNDVPHLGNGYATIVADALAAWHRLVGEDVFFLTGTDEHGLKVLRSAEQNGMRPQEWTDVLSERFRAAWAELEISNDDFIRTTEERHHRTVQRFMQAIYDNGYLRKGTYEGWYCVSCEAYYGESELLDGRLCRVHERPAEWFSEENWFFELSRFSDRLLDWYDGHPGAIFPETRRNEALGIIRGGLQDISITRTSIDWGVPVPWDEGHVFYVWYDALVNYISAIGYGSDEERFDRWWPAVCHLIGKDIIRFHCVWWPAMCMAAGIEPPSSYVVTGFLLVGGKKMAKSAFNQIYPVELAADIGNDALRYYLLREVGLGADGEFSYEGLVARHNSDLANNLGNLLSRVSTVVASKCEGRGPAPRAAAEGSRLAEVAAEIVPSVVAHWRAFAPQEGLEETWKLIRAANAELEMVAPWKLEPGPEVDAVLGDALEVLRIVAVLISPVLRRTAAEIWRRLGLEGDPGASGNAGSQGVLSWGGYPGGLPVEKGEPLFPRRKVEQ